LGRGQGGEGEADERFDGDHFDEEVVFVDVMGFDLIELLFDGLRELKIITIVAKQ